MTLRLSRTDLKALFAQRGRPREAKPRKPPRREEAALQRQVLGWLSLKGWFHWRANAGGGLRPGRGGRMVPVKANPEGIPDVMCVLPGGRLCGIELKSPGGRLRPAQKAWMEKAERAGCLCLVVRSLEQLQAALAAEGVVT